MLTIKTSKRSDALETERFHEMMLSEPFNRLTARIAEMLATASRDCEREEDQTKLRRAQGQTLALRAVLQLPDRILEDLRDRQKP